MKSSILKISAALLIFSFATSNLFLAFPQKANAQAGAATSCTAGYLAALTASAPAWVQNAAGVPKSQIGDTTQNIVTSGSANSLSFNNCILKPLGTMIVISLIRNIGASVVDWVNSGFEGKPSFVTDFGGTLLNAADQAIGKFIEGTELGFLCSDFSFQIRIALALKYSKPYREEVRCTLSGIGDNFDNFVENNGGAGWDNWLKLTTEPNNNVYGAYLIADSELAARALSATGLKEKKITIGQGFLDFETCDEYETPSEAQTRYLQESSSFQNPTSGEQFDAGLDVNTDINSFDSVGVESENSNLNSSTFDSGLASQNSSAAFSAPAASVTPQCKPGKMTSKTPGRIIAGKLDSVLGQGEIQAAVAQEIDQVIAATLNQLATMAIQGAGGLLGLSKKNSYSSASVYASKYQSQYYGQASQNTANTGASSQLDTYRVINYNDASALFSDPNNAGLQDIQQLIDTTVASASGQQQQQITAVTDNNSRGTTTNNAALLKSASQSSGSRPGNANDGIRTTNKYIKGSTTGNKDASAWWEVDLGRSTNIQSVNIWKLSGGDGEKTLGTFRVKVGEDRSNMWSTDSLDGAAISEPIIVSVNRTGRYVRIEKNAFSYNCGNVRIPQTCYYPLELAEVEVITPVDVFQPSATSTTSSQQGTVVASSTATVTVQVPASTVKVKSLEKVSVTIPVLASASTVVPSLEVSISSGGKPIRFDSVLTNPALSIKRGGITNNFYVSSDSGLIFPNVPAGGTNNTSISLSGSSIILQRGASYQLRVTSKNSSNATTSTGTVNFVVE